LVISELRKLRKYILLHGTAALHGWRYFSQNGHSRLRVVVQDRRYFRIYRRNASSKVYHTGY